MDAGKHNRPSVCQVFLWLPEAEPVKEWQIGNESAQLTSRSEGEDKIYWVQDWKDRRCHKDAGLTHSDYDSLPMIDSHLLFKLPSSKLWAFEL